MLLSLYSQACVTCRRSIIGKQRNPNAKTNCQQISSSDWTGGADAARSQPLLSHNVRVWYYLIASATVLRSCLPPDKCSDDVYERPHPQNVLRESWGKEKNRLACLLGASPLFQRRKKAWCVQVSASQGDWNNKFSLKIVTFIGR